MFTQFMKFTTAMHVIYLTIVLFSLISITKPYFLTVQILFYIANGAFLAVYLAFEVSRWQNSDNKFTEPKAVSYSRTIATTVIVALAFSAFSGYHSFTSFYSYNVKSHLFLFVSNMLLFMTKIKLIFGVQIVLAQVMSYVAIVIFMGVIIVYFEENKGG